MSSKELKLSIIDAGEKAVKQLVKVFQLGVQIHR